MTTDPTVMATGAMCCAPEHLNYLTVLIAGAANFVIGGLWYSQYMFAKPWMKAAKINPRKMNTSNMGLMYAGWVAMSLLSALSIAYLLKLTHAATLVDVLRTAWTAWFGFVVVGAMGDYLAMQRGMKLFAINMGQQFVTITVSALIVSASAIVQVTTSAG